LAQGLSSMKKGNCSMAKLEKYRYHIKELLKQYGSYKPSYGEVEVELIFDTENDHYQLMTVGWNKQQRIHGCIVHIDIKGEKIWIQHDGTETGSLLIEPL
jgi:hypothetical protein